MGIQVISKNDAQTCNSPLMPNTLPTGVECGKVLAKLHGHCLCFKPACTECESPCLNSHHQDQARGSTQEYQPISAETIQIMQGYCSNGPYSTGERLPLLGCLLQLQLEQLTLRVMAASIRAQKDLNPDVNLANPVSESVGDLQRPVPVCHEQ
eukprot:1157747-Pelagomonas_calceolata.AAC.5